MAEPVTEQMARAPWTADQIASLNGYQEWGHWHPFTCGGPNLSTEPGAYCGGLLLATEAGWRCPSCAYTQDWAHPWMADWSWKRQHEALMREVLGAMDRAADESVVREEQE